MVNFLLLIDYVQNYTKKDVDKGLTPFVIYRLCSCIREAFCLSYSIRKENNLFLYFHKTLTLIKFQGNKLRFLGSDERSQALLLNKAISKLNEINHHPDFTESTPGIFIRKFRDLNDFLKFIKKISQNKIILINSNNEEDFLLDKKEFSTLKALNNYLYILPIFYNESKEIEFIGSIKEMVNFKLVQLPKIKNIENKILYINFVIDQQLTS